MYCLSFRGGPTSVLIHKLDSPPKVAWMNDYEKGVKVSDADMATLNITPSNFHSEWNYTIAPRRKRR